MPWTLQQPNIRPPLTVPRMNRVAHLLVSCQVSLTIDLGQLYPGSRGLK
jgi:hypothetical protein